MEKHPEAPGPEKAPQEKQLDEKELERKMRKDQKAKEKEEKRLKAKQKEAARLQATSDGPKKSEKKQKKKAVENENPEDFVDPDTPHGRKKLLAPQMAKQYSPSVVEKAWYAWWESSGYFGADSASTKPPFVIVLPPPNVTGALHIGHALTVAIEDAMIRWRRMSGFIALWVPGVDHAGIATQVVVEKKLMREKKLTRHDIGRDNFIAEAFTMDEPRSKAVTEAFVRLYKEGLIYRDYRLVNWDCTLRTAISDIEVDHIDLKGETTLKVPGYNSYIQFGVLISFAYPLEKGLGEIVVATTRIETMLGDTAIAVHPEDKRYKHLHGRYAVHPFHARKLKIICDAELVDPTFGTGAVKITPAHDPNDFELKLASLHAFGWSLQGHTNNEMSLGVCSRTNDVVEPMIKPQWFVNCNTMAKAGLDAVRIVSYTHIYHIKSVKVLEDPYISAFLADGLKTYTIGAFQGNFGGAIVYPHDDTADLRAFYPTSVLETGLDILFFWVARMVMMGMQLGGDVPFQKVGFICILLSVMLMGARCPIDPREVINGMSLDGLLKRLEEGNLDPNELNIAKEGKKKDYSDGIAECGTDALRFALISYTSQSDRINLDIKRVVGYRQWCNKLWNAIRFAMGKLGDNYTPPANVDVSLMPPICKWILSVLNKAIWKTVTSLEGYKFSDATSAIYSWWQYQLCDVFIEAIKPYFFNDSQEFESARAASRDTLWVCLDAGLRLLHPFMPYVTEELWQRLPHPKYSCRKDSIMISEYPSPVEEWTNGKLENELNIVLDAVSKLRSLKPPTETNERCVYGLIFLCNTVGLQSILGENDGTPADCATAVVNKDLFVYLQLQGSLNAEAEREKLRKKRDEVQKLQHAMTQKMDASGYREKAPKSVQEEDERKLIALMEQLEIISEAEKKLDAKTGKN
ncbi:hypothetical protein EJB05_16085 [Eragrostis curvula]|uniref:valine--tRNA ligase n=1 Tax=Eragrostis curvula TaxID=38414 RepID=A0A5J9VFV5_9POAL|nr:hypothetical protein EJB05_16085 [Eragrostis curvula]